MCVVMEFVESDLDQLLKKRIAFEESHLVKIVYNSLLAMSFIHFTNVVHRDIKPGNLLLTSNCGVKICDFGLSRSISVCPKPS